MEGELFGKTKTLAKVQSEIHLEDKTLVVIASLVGSNVRILVSISYGKLLNLSTLSKVFVTLEDLLRFLVDLLAIRTQGYGYEHIEEN